MRGFGFGVLGAPPSIHKGNQTGSQGATKNLEVDVRKQASHNSFKVELPHDRDGNGQKDGIGGAKTQMIQHP